MLASLLAGLRGHPSVGYPFGLVNQKRQSASKATSDRDRNFRHPAPSASPRQTRATGRPLRSFWLFGISRTVIGIIALSAQRKNAAPGTVLFPSCWQENLRARSAKPAPLINPLRSENYAKTYDTIRRGAHLRSHDTKLCPSFRISRFQDFTTILQALREHMLRMSNFA
jgi:hypothetical protein